MKIQTWFDKIDGKIIMNEGEKYHKLINSLPDGRYIHQVDKVQNQRSLEQNNAMWGIPYLFFERVLVEAGEFQNPSKQQIHEWCMHYCLPEDYKERIRQEWEAQKPLIGIKTGEMFKTPFRLTTTKMTTIDAMHYYENMQNFYAENFSSGEKDFIPDPDPAKKKKRLIHT